MGNLADDFEEVVINNIVYFLITYIGSNWWYAADQQTNHISIVYWSGE